ncbi:cephalosporin hydroxylase family protein [Fusibacter sp. 3D3]|uniref:cephalosporin hydroxylase family protein n=1 Tax=Fusibacter sp. 3D3 TaxID=1048380 RepID=UPI000852B93B|nr:cephalosporin hydroxylase family protein [Fusibacter sp. 3D3]GAU75652.1 cephalosporin hydroxylase [Fusibacter sp. 3D3]
MGKIEEFHLERKRAIEAMTKDEELKELTKAWSIRSGKYDYVYNSTWMGVPMLQVPSDILALQSIIWEVKPDLIIETGIAYGGSLIFSASMLELLGGEGEVIGIDIDIRAHNREAIESHPMFKRITLIEGSSTSESVFNQVKKIVNDKHKIMVILDSNHTHEHVYKELQLYSSLVSTGSYIVVFDTIIEMSNDVISEGRDYRPWSKGNNPWTAAMQFLEENDAFEIDSSITDRFVITAAPDGYLKKIR